MFFLRRITRKLNRNRFLYALFIIITLTIGVTLIVEREYFPSFVNLYVTNALWAVVIFLVIGFVFKRYSIWQISIIALAVVYGIEIVQMFNIAWVDKIRATILGTLLLGKGFLWNDMICYTIGVLLGATGEFVNYKLDFMFINKIK